MTAPQFFTVTRDTTDHERAIRAVQLLDELAHVLASIHVPDPSNPYRTLFSFTRHQLEALRRMIGELDQYAIRDAHRPIVWRVAPAGGGLPASLYADRRGIGSVAVSLNPDSLQRHGWHYLEDVARQMTEALQ